MSDLFNKDIPQTFISRVFDTMEKANWHIYQVLTKRSGRLREFVNTRFSEHNAAAPPHLWLGVSVEDKSVLSRIQHLRETKASVRFLSIEPLLESLGQLDLSGIHWVIVGGESGHHSRPVKPEWVQDIRDQCLSARVPFFFKQWGGFRPKSGGNELDGRTWLQYPSMVSRLSANVSISF